MVSVRTELLLSLTKELLGPRDSSNEVLPPDVDPRNEFITGILIPKTASNEDASDIEAQVDTIKQGVEFSYEDDLEDETTIIATSPILDPKSLPKSLGISFIVTSNTQSPQIAICATWARYKDEKNAQRKTVYRRIPNGYVTEEFVSIERNMLLKEIDSLQLSLRVVSLEEHTYKVSVYLVNNSQLTGEPDQQGKPLLHTRDMIFQPQLRIVCAENTQLLPFDSFTPELEKIPTPGSIEEEDESLALIYRDYQAYARGHLCAAVWKEIDPTRPYQQDDNPLTWVDGEIIKSQYGEAQWRRFILPDCRTEYIPSYPIKSPEIDWDFQLGNKPELSTAKLSELWDEQQIRQALQPLVTGYGNWIEQNKQKISSLEVRYQRAAQRHLQLCQIAQERIQKAVDLIATDEQVRLAFCFANKAIDLQASWKAKQKAPSLPFEFKWRPFQLAFILLNIVPIANPQDKNREVCDLLAFATGGGKTEAYLGLAAFTLGLRRLRSKLDADKDRTGHGVSVISRYTLRLLTIQQFRRALGLIVACEVLRVKNLCSGHPGGWRPEHCTIKDKNIWGTTRFSCGLWVGGNVTPNALKDKFVSSKKLPGAISALQGGKTNVEGEPAQVLNCPCCNAILAIPRDGLGSGEHQLHLIVKGKVFQELLGQETSAFQLEEEMEKISFKVENYLNNLNLSYSTISIYLVIKPNTIISVKKLENWWDKQIKPQISDSQLVPFRISRPGYFPRSYQGKKGKENIENFEIYCPNPQCELNNTQNWGEKVPLKFNQECKRPIKKPETFVWETPLEPFQKNSSYSYRIPISAYTVDDQIYSRIPSLLVATVDKFARLAFEPRASSLFGNINSYCSREGYYRVEVETKTPKKQPKKQQKEVLPLVPPDLILQDELHLIEGPLGSMVGIYETAVDALCQTTEQGKIIRPKYIASTATVRQSASQIRCLFDREVFQFPPLGLSAADNFFARTQENLHPLEVNSQGQHPSGRLYVAICAPGKGAQTPIVRIYARLLQTIAELKQKGISDNLCDPYWTLVGYFNAIRELAGALSLYRQDIPERLQYIARLTGTAQRELAEAIELSSRRDSTELPGLLNSLSQELPEAQDIVLSTSMFGTGVDIDRLGLMVVNGQPKTTSAYIQATGRVGRRVGGLVVTFFRASRPRDLDHYEFFTGYHRAIYRYVEPVTVTPFASRAREKALGPVAVALLRQGREIQGIPINQDWASKASLMKEMRSIAKELDIIVEVLTQRSQNQTDIRRPPRDQVETEIKGGFDRWQILAETEQNLKYEEYAIDKAPTVPVVLGDEQHQTRNFPVVYNNAPQSLREVEGMTRFGSNQD